MKSSWVYKTLAISVAAYFAGLPFVFESHILGSDNAVVWCGAVLLVLSMTSLVALIFPAIRAGLSDAKQRPGLLISLAVIALYSVWAGSLLVFPISE